MNEKPSPSDVQLEACRAYARMMNNLDYAHLEPWLADDFHYSSQWVLEELTSKDRYAEYIQGKLATIRREGSRVWAEIGYTNVFGAGPCVVLAQNDPLNPSATLLITMRGDQIVRMDMCFVPAPGDCRRTGEFPV